MSYCLFVNFIVVYMIVTFYTEVFAKPALEESYKEIFSEDYDMHEPPWKKGNAAQVYLQLCILDIDKIDDGAMLVSIQAYLTEKWKDDRLNLTKFQKDDDSSIFPPYLSKHVWLPDLIFDNTKNGMMFHLSLPNTFIKVMNDGSFYRSTRYNLDVGCQMDFRLYPMDTQYCFIKIATLTSTEVKVQLKWIENSKSILLMKEIEPLMYTLLKPQPYTTAEVWSLGSYTYLYANFTFVRRISGSLFNVYVPSTLVVFLSWISFWLDGESVPARVTLGVTSLLTLATQVQNAHAGLPQISYMTAIDVWLFACLVMVFSSLIEFAFAYQLLVLAKKKTVVNSPPAGGNTVKLPKEREKRIFLSRNEDSLSKKNIHSKENSQKLLLERVKEILTFSMDQKCLDKACRVVFPLAFVVFTIFYWIWYLS